MKNRLVAYAVGVAIFAMGCTTTGTNVRYDDPQSVQTNSMRFAATDLHLIAEKMVDSMLTFPPLVEMTANRRPVLFVDSIKNNTTAHTRPGSRERIDTVSITDTISTKLLHSGKFRFVDMTKIDAVLDQMEFQQSGIVDPSTAIQFGKQIGAELMLYGNISSIKTDPTVKVKNVYYKFTLKLMNLETGIVEWMDEKEISKTGTRNTFGS